MRPASSAVIACLLAFPLILSAGWVLLVLVPQDAQQAIERSALAASDPRICMNLSSYEMRESCLQSTINANRHPEWCLGLTDWAERCLYTVSEMMANSSICALIPDEKNKASCILKAGRTERVRSAGLGASPSSWSEPSNCEYLSTSAKTSCLEYAAIFQGDPNVCARANLKKDECMGVLLKALKDPGVCGKLAEPMERDRCLLRYAEGTNESSACKDIADLGLEGECYTSMARNLADMALCERPGNQYMRNNCYLEVGRAHDLPQACEKITSEMDGRSICFNSVAQSLRSAELCQKTSESFREYCLKNVAAAKGGGSPGWVEITRRLRDCQSMGDTPRGNSCIMDLVNASRDPTLCPQLVGRQVADCYLKLAAPLKLPNLCYSTDRVTDRDFCLREVAVAASNFSVCDGIQDRSILTECYRDVAALSNDSAICERTPYEGYFKDDCYRLVGRALGNMTLCGRAKDPETRDECIIEIATRSGKSLSCTNINTERMRIYCDNKPPVTESPCNDTDGGKDYYVAGFAHRRENGQIYSFYDGCLMNLWLDNRSFDNRSLVRTNVYGCTGGNCFLSEAGCVDGKVATSSYQCPYGCVLGACRRSPEGKAVLPDSSEDCGGKSVYSDKLYCLRDQASYNKNPAICEQIDNGFQREDCLAYVAEAKNDPSACNALNWSQLRAPCQAYFNPRPEQ